MAKWQDAPLVGGAATPAAVIARSAALGGGREQISAGGAGVTAQPKWATAPIISDGLDPNKRGGLALNTTAGLNESLYKTFGTPVDLISGAMQMLTRTPQTPDEAVAMLPNPALVAMGPVGTVADFAGKAMAAQESSGTAPVGGSQWISDFFTALGTPDPNSIEAKDYGDKLARMFGEGVGYTVGPEAALAALMKTGVTAGRAAELLQETLGSAQTVRGTAVNALAGGASAPAAQIAADAAPEPFKPLASIVGGLAGAGGAVGLLHGAPTLAKAATTKAADYLAPITQSGRERVAGEQLAAAAQTPAPELAAQLSDAAELVPGSQPTTFQATGDMGLGSLERAAAARDPARFNTRRAEQNTARLGAIDNLTPEGSPEAVVGAVRKHVQDIDNNWRQTVEAETTRARTSAEALGPGKVPEEAGADIRATYETARNKAKESERALWRVVDPSGDLTVKAPSFKTRASQLTSEMPMSAKPMEGEEKAIFDLVKKYGGGDVAFSEITALQSRIKAEMRRDFAENGFVETPSYRRLTLLNQAIEGDLDGAILTRAADDPNVVRRLLEMREGFSARNENGGGSPRPDGVGGAEPVSGVRPGSGDQGGEFAGAPRDRGVPQEQGPAPAAVDVAPSVGRFRIGENLPNSRNLLREAGATRPRPRPEAPPAPEPAPVAPKPRTPAPAASESEIVGLSPENVAVDAKRFQFKSGGDAEGVTERLQGIKKWDPRLGGVAIVFRDSAGRDFVADGHQRFGLARQLMDEGHEPIKVNSFVLDERNGFTDAQARAIAAVKNIAEGTGSPVDTAKVLREAKSSGIDLPELPPRSALVRDGEALAKLDNEAFGIIVNEVVPYQQGSIVGRLVKDGADQVEALRLLAQMKPDNLTQAEMIVRDMMSSGTERSSTGSLFGEEAFAESIVRERAKIADEALKALKRDKATFRSLVENSERIQKEGGNVLDRGANESRLSTDEQAADSLKQLAFRAGPVSDALSAVARELKAGTISAAEAARRFLGDVRTAVEAGGEPGAGARGTEPRGSERGPGEVEPVSRETSDDDETPLFQSAPPVESPAFARWFGDSKVVDEKGEPLVVYHGTNPEFEAFGKGRPSTEGGMNLEQEGVTAHFFTNKRDIAEDFAQGARGANKPRVVEAYLRLERPLIIDAKGRGWDEFEDQVIAAYDDGKVDGVILRDTSDFMFGENIESDRSDVYVAFEPTQIKSVNNRGTFDPKDPRILYQPEVAARAVEDGTPIAKAIRDGMVAAGRPEIEGEMLGTATDAFYSTMAKRMGMTAEAMVKKFKLPVFRRGGDVAEGALSQGATIDAAAKREILASSRVSIGRKIGDKIRVWRGEGDISGRGMATYGLGEYSTADRSVAKDYAGDSGTVRELDHSDLPRNPLRFNTKNDFQIWLQQAQRRLGYTDNRDFAKAYDDIGVFIRALDPEVDGIQIFTGKDTVFVRYPDAPLNQSGKPSPWREGEMFGGFETERELEGLPQTLVPGVKPLTDAERMAQAAAKPLKKGEAPPPKGGLFDVEGREDAAAQMTLFQPAYHGTPHVFDKFSSDKIGTGEGAQAYGHGLYFAGKKEVAKWYKDTLARDTIVTDDGSLTIRQAEDTLDAAITRAVPDIPDDMVAGILFNIIGDLRRDTPLNARDSRLAEAPEKYRLGYEAAVATAKSWKAEKSPGRLFKVDIPADDELMNWDAPLSEQPPKVKEALGQFGSMDTFLRDAERQVGGAENAAALKVTTKAKRFYDFLSRKLGGDTAASEWLREHGVPGHRYVGDSSQATNYVIYDDSRINVLDFEQGADGGPRAAIQFDDDGSVISLFAGADASSALHETGHHFLRMFKSLAETPEAPRDVKTDWQTTKAWWGKNAGQVAADAKGAKVTAADVRTVLKDGTTGDRVKDLAINVGFHEQFARGFEQYMRTGQAPNERLRGVFERFRDWLTTIYRKATDLKVEVSPEIRGVFDRMLSVRDSANGRFVDQAAAARLRTARAATRERYATFDNPTLKPLRTRNDKLTDAAAPAKLFATGAKSHDAIQSYLKAVGPQGEADIEAYAINRLLKSALKDDGTLDPKALARFRQAHGDALRALPDLDARLANAETAADAVGDVVAAHKAAVAEVEKSSLAKFLKIDDPDEVVRAVGNIFKATDGITQMRRLSKAIGDDRMGQAGLKRAVVDHMVSRLASNTEAATSGKELIKSDQFQTFVGDNKTALRAAGFSDEEINTFERIAKDLQRANRSITAVKIPGGSNTAQDLKALSTHLNEKPESLLTKLAAWSFHLGGGFALGHIPGAAAGLGVILLRGMRHAGMKKLDDLLTDALLDPALARQLLLKAAPAVQKRIEINAAQRMTRSIMAGLAAAGTDDGED